MSQMKNYIIVCEDLFGLNIKRIIDEANTFWNRQGQPDRYSILGYMTPDGRPLHIRSMTFLGGIKDCNSMPDAEFVMGIVNPQHKEEAVLYMKERNARFATIRAPWVLAPPKMTFPEGCIIAAVTIKEFARIGKFVTLYYSMLGPAHVGDYSSIMAYTNLTTAKLGQRVCTGPNSVIMEDVQVGDDAIVYPNSVVVKTVKPNTRVLGVPARKIKEEVI